MRGGIIGGGIGGIGVGTNKQSKRLFSSDKLLIESFHRSDREKDIINVKEQKRR